MKATGCAGKGRRGERRLGWTWWVDEGGGKGNDRRGSSRFSGGVIQIGLNEGRQGSRIAVDL